jgi:hypothetical protein
MEYAVRVRERDALDGLIPFTLDFVPISLSTPFTPTGEPPSIVGLSYNVGARIRSPFRESTPIQHSQHDPHQQRNPKQRIPREHHILHQ